MFLCKSSALSFFSVASSGISLSVMSSFSSVSFLSFSCFFSPDSSSVISSVTTLFFFQFVTILCTTLLCTGKLFIFLINFIFLVT